MHPNDDDRSQFMPRPGGRAPEPARAGRGPVAPRQLPYHAGSTYYELDRGSEHWQQLSNSGGFAFHIAGQFPGLNLAFWAIRG